MLQPAAWQRRAAQAGGTSSGRRMKAEWQGMAQSEKARRLGEDRGECTESCMAHGIKERRGENGGHVRGERRERWLRQRVAEVRLTQ